MTGIHARERCSRTRGGGIAVSGADKRGLQGARRAGWKGKTLALGQNLPIDGSVKKGDFLPKEDF